MVRKIREKSLIISILLIFGFSLTIYKWITANATIEIFIGLLMFIAMLIGILYFIVWANTVG